MGHSYNFRNGRKPAEGAELKERSERPQGTRGKAAISELRVKEADNGGHIVEHHFQSGPEMHYKEHEQHVFAESKGSPELPKGHVLQHIAAAMKIPHRILGAGQADEDEEEKELIPK